MSTCADNGPGGGQIGVRRASEPEMTPQGGAFNFPVKRREVPPIFDLLVKWCKLGSRQEEYRMRPTCALGVTPTPSPYFPLPRRTWHKYDLGRAHQGHRWGTWSRPALLLVWPNLHHFHQTVSKTVKNGSCPVFNRKKWNALGLPARRLFCPQFVLR